MKTDVFVTFFKTLSVIFFLSLPLFLNAQDSKEIFVKLKRIVGNFPFSVHSYRITPSQYPTKDNFPGIPANIDTFIVYEYDLNQTQGFFDKIQQGVSLSRQESKILSKADKSMLTKKHHHHSVHLLVGFREANNEKVIIVDEDNDGDFSNNRILSFDTSEEYNLRDAKTVFVNYEVYDGQKIVWKNRLFKVAPLLNFSDLYSEMRIADKDFTIYLIRNEYKTGVLQLGNKSYYFALRGDYLDSKNVFQLFVSPPNEWFSRQTDPETGHKIHDTIYLNNAAYQINGVIGSDNEQSLKLTLVDKSPNKKVGRIAGNYSYTFEAISLADSATVSSSSLHGKFTLLDFWGPWCAPCIKNFPELKALYQKYSNNLSFDMIGVIFPLNGIDVFELSQFVQKHELEWRQLVDDGYNETGPIQRLMITSYPTLILLDPEGKILHRGGQNSIGKIEMLLAKHL